MGILLPEPSIVRRRGSRVYTAGELERRTGLVCDALRQLAAGDVEACEVSCAMHAAGAVDGQTTVPPGMSGAQLHGAALRLLTPVRT
jgi:hypothetical protein